MKLKSGSFNIRYEKGSHSKEVLKDLFTSLLLPRMIEEKMLNLLRQGQISKWFSGIGQEAISVGITKALLPDEFIFPVHRNLGVFTCRNVPLERLFAQWRGKSTGFTKGRDRSFHFGTLEHYIVGMISHLGSQLSLADGVALGCKLNAEGRVTVALTGEGGTSEGEFHEALNVAAVWQLPVIFVIENNKYGLSTPEHEQYRCNNLTDKGIGYGVKSFDLDGNNIIEIYSFFRKWCGKIRKNPEPLLVECSTFRIRGHEEASGTKYVPDSLVKKWTRRDPVINFKNFLLHEGILTTLEIEIIEQDLSNRIELAWDKSSRVPEIIPSAASEEADTLKEVTGENESIPGHGARKMRFIDAISDSLNMEMARNTNIILMGQDIGEYGGVFKVTEGFLEKYGRERVRNTPLCESAIIGAAIGLTFKGYKPIVEMQFADFVTCGFNQIVNNLAKMNYRWGHAPSVVIRMPTGANVGAGPFHSQSLESWFVHTPGLKVVYPSTPADAKGLLLASLNDPNPVLYFEHKYLYRSIEEEVPSTYYTIPLGKANLVAEGATVSIITYGLGVHWAKDAIRNLEIQADILDLRTLLPMDYKAIETTVKKTGKVLILTEATLTGGVGGEIAGIIAEHFFEYLDAPLVRCASLDTPVPFAKTLEEHFLPGSRLEKKLQLLVKY